MILMLHVSCRVHLAKSLSSARYSTTWCALLTWLIFHIVLMKEFLIFQDSDKKVCEKQIPHVHVPQVCVPQAVHSGCVLHVPSHSLPLDSKNIYIVNYSFDLHIEYNMLVIIAYLLGIILTFLGCMTFEYIFKQSQMVSV